MKNRATPSRRTAGPQASPGERAQAADGGDQADDAGLEPDLGREHEVDRAEDAPEAGDRGVGEGERPKDRVAEREPQALADLADDAWPLLGRAGRRLGSPDAAQQHRRDEERDRVDGDRDRGGQDLDEPAADAEPDELRRGAAAGQRRVRLDEPLSTDDGRQEGAVGGVEERRQDRGPEGDDHQLDERQGEGKGERDRTSRQPGRDPPRS